MTISVMTISVTCHVHTSGVRPASFSSPRSRRSRRSSRSRRTWRRSSSLSSPPATTASPGEIFDNLIILINNLISGRVYLSSNPAAAARPAGVFRRHRGSTWQSTGYISDDYISDDYISDDHISDDHISDDHISDDHIRACC